MNTVQKEKSSKKILELSADENLRVVYQDEVHFHVQSTVTCGWYKKGSQPEIGSLPGRDKISYSGFVLPESGELFVNKPPLFNFQTTLDSIRAFLQAHPVPHGKKYVLIMDNASWHKKAARLVREDPQGEYRDISSAVTFLFLVYLPLIRYTFFILEFSAIFHEKTPNRAFMMGGHMIGPTDITAITR